MNEGRKIGDVYTDERGTWQVTGKHSRILLEPAPGVPDIMQSVAEEDKKPSLWRRFVDALNKDIT